MHPRLFPMKASFIALLLLLVCCDHSWSRTRILPDVPIPKLTVEKVLAIATAKLGKDANRYAVDWCIASDFQPRYSDGSTCSPAGDQPKDYSWFVTYLYHDDHAPNATQPLNAVMVMRIKDDGSIGRLISVRT